MHDYCTLFDKNYLFQGVALYRSLVKTVGEFRLYALCMDRESYDMISKLGRPDLVPIQVGDLEDDETRAVRARTTHGQFCWVCQPLVCRYILDRYQVEMVTYLEADSMFFSNPAVLFRELDGYSVSLVGHRFTPEFDKAETSGKFCVQFNAFRNDSRAREVLDHWRECCFRYDKEKPNCYPGQVTLDEWPARFSCVKEIEHVGAGVAPWNIQKYTLGKSGDQLTVDGMPIVFYHYHQYCRYQDGSHELGFYPFRPEVIEWIYRPYAREVAGAEEWVKGVDPSFTYRRQAKKPKSLVAALASGNMAEVRESIGTQMRRVKGTYNIYPHRSLL